MDRFIVFSRPIGRYRPSVWIGPARRGGAGLPKIFPYSISFFPIFATIELTIFCQSLNIVPDFDWEGSLCPSSLESISAGPPPRSWACPDGSHIAMHRVQAQDPITSLYGALGNFLFTNGLQLSDVDRIALTGVG